MSMKEIWITGKKGFPPKWLLALDRYYPRCAYSLGVWNTFFLRLGSGGCSVRSSADTCHSLPEGVLCRPILRRKPIPLEWRRRPGRIYSSCDNGIRPWIPAQLFSRLSIPLDLAPYNLSLLWLRFFYCNFYPKRLCIRNHNLIKKINHIISTDPCKLQYSIIHKPLHTTSSALPNNKLKPGPGVGGIVQNTPRPRFPTEEEPLPPESKISGNE